MIEEYVYKHKDGSIERLNIPYTDLNIPPGVEQIAVVSDGVEHDLKHLEEVRNSVNPLRGWHNFTITSDVWGKL